MKTFKAICAATLLALSLSIPAYADTAPGDIHQPGQTTPVEPPRAPETTGIAPAADGDVSFSAFADIMWALTSMF